MAGVREPFGWARRPNGAGPSGPPTYPQPCTRRIHSLGEPYADLCLVKRRALLEGAVRIRQPPLPYQALQPQSVNGLVAGLGPNGALQERRRVRVLQTQHARRPFGKGPKFSGDGPHAATSLDGCLDVVPAPRRCDGDCSASRRLRSADASA